MNKPQVAKTRKYFKAREIEDKTQSEALKEAGMNPEFNHGTRMEQSKQYAKLLTKYATTLTKKISLDELADEHKKNIMQDKDRGAKNTAIKMAIDKIEPEGQAQLNVGDVTIVVKPK